MSKNTCCIILEYCGGKKTDSLYLKLTRWNPGYSIHILDNASHQNRCSFITRQNVTNSGIGGGIIDCLKMAKDEGAKYLFFIANDIVPLTRIEIAYFEEMLEKFPGIVQLSASITKNSDQGRHFPWMINQRASENRVAPHSDILCCALNIDFIERFGGFPFSRGGWGYDWEIAYQAKLSQKLIVISDYLKIKHINESGKQDEQSKLQKLRELQKIYDQKYGSCNTIFGVF